MKRTLLALMLLASMPVFFSFRPTLLRAQVTTATVHGLVLDTSGAAVPGAKVTFAGQGTVYRQVLTTNERGEFTVPFVPVGKYSITIEMAGFRALSQQNLDLVAGREVRQNFTLQVGTVGETLTVSAEAPLINAVNAQQDVNLGEMTVRELPLARRDINNILNLAVGVSSGTDVGVSMNGLPPRGFLFTIDGVNAHGDAELRSLGLYQDFNYIKGVTVEAVEQVQVAKSIFSAEIANTIGGNVNLITKSGSNEYHGTTFWNYQSGGLNARNQFLTTKPPLVFHQFGGSFGGPIRKEKMFFFTAFEVYRNTAQRALTGNVPSQELRDLAIKAYPTMKSLFDLWPLPTVAPTAGADIGFYQGTGAATASDNHAVVRWDYNLTPLNVLNIRYTRGRPNLLTPTVLAAGAQTQTGLQENVSGTFIHAAPTWSAQTRAGYNRDDLTRTDGLYTLGIAAISGPGFSTPGNRLFVKSGSTTSIEEVIALNRGRHSIKTGGTFQLLYVRRTDQQFAGYAFQTRADLVSASPTSASYRFGVKPWQMTSWQLGGFVQDDIKLTQKLMLNLGVRYDYFSVPRERDGRIFNRDGAFGSYRPADSAWVADHRDISPRISLAYRLDSNGRTVLRTGYGIFFSRQNLFSGPVELMRDGANIPFTASFSRAELTRFGLNYPDGNDKALPQVTSVGLITDQSVDPNWKNPYSQQWTFGIQRQISNTMVLDVAYVGSHALRLPYSPAVNRVDRVTGLRPVAGFGTFTYYQSADSSNYNALQTSFQKRFSKNLSFDTAYTWASNMAYFRGDMHCCGGGEQPQELNDLRSNRGPTTFFIRHQFRSNWIYELPFASLMPNGGRLAKLALGGWQVAGMFFAQSGQSVQISQSSATPGARPDYVGGPAVLNRGLQYLNLAAFAKVPIHPVSRATVRPGTLGHRAVFGPGFWSMDVSLSKRLRFTERCNLQLRADMFNAFNKTDFSGFSTSIDSAAFGVFTSTRGARVVQLNLRLQF